MNFNVTKMFFAKSKLQKMLVTIHNVSLEVCLHSLFTKEKKIHLK